MKRRIKRFTSKDCDYFHDLLVEMHNNVMARGFSEPQFLEYLLSWVRSSKQTAKTYGYHNKHYPTNLPKPKKYLTDP